MFRSKGGVAPAIMRRGISYMKGIKVGTKVADFGGFYVDIFDGIPADDYGSMDAAIEYLKETVIENMTDIYPTFTKTKKWEHEGVVILENHLAQVVIGEGHHNSMIVYIVIPSSDAFPYAELGKKKLRRYLASLRDILLKHYPGKVRLRTGPWSKGILRAAI